MFKCQVRITFPDSVCFFLWFEAFAWQGSASFSVELKNWLPSRIAHHFQPFPLDLCFFVHEFTNRDGRLFLRLLHFFVLLCLLPRNSRLWYSLICTLWKPVVCLSTTCTLFNPLLSLLTTNMLCLQITNGYMGIICKITRLHVEWFLLNYC